ncbi:MAG TPA: hydrogenase/urease maturation nickel metallochaperone HypA [Thermoplasmata archaeon]|jgi:Zn finger protein HypA/HybF involved in hydrogenase expression|nr:hydrogenase/urease maturation nickel metallochaperone HypA [Thermoplasmata archaeon]
MHEQAIVRDLVREVNEIARRSGLARVRRVRVWIGPLSHLTEAGLRAAWTDAARGSVAAGGAISVEVSDDLADPRAQDVRLVAVEGDDRP